MSWSCKILFRLLQERFITVLPEPVKSEKSQVVQARVREKHPRKEDISFQNNMSVYFMHCGPQ